MTKTIRKAAVRQKPTQQPLRRSAAERLLARSAVLARLILDLESDAENAAPKTSVGTIGSVSIH